MIPQQKTLSELPQAITVKQRWTFRGLHVAGICGPNGAGEIFSQTSLGRSVGPEPSSVRGTISFMSGTREAQDCCVYQSPANLPDYSGTPPQGQASSPRVSGQRVQSMGSTLAATARGIAGNSTKQFNGLIWPDYDTLLTRPTPGSGLTSLCRSDRASAQATPVRLAPELSDLLSERAKGLSGSSKVK